MTEPSGGADGPQPELRLALAMRGGVSLAVWMGGACAEIDELRRAPAAAGPAASGERAADDSDESEASSFWRQVLALSPYSNVVVDVMAGASAGGLNGVLFASAIRHGFPMSDLLPVWKQVADVNELRRSEPPWVSLLDGDRAFLDEIDRQLVRLTKEAEGEVTPEVEVGGYVDLQLTATLVEPITQPAVSPTDEALRRSRSAARFHFRHDPDSVFPRRDLERQGVSRLAVAARASASFPFAFEAAVVRSSRPDRFEVRAPRSGPGSAGANGSPDARRLVDCRGVFSESNGPASPREAPLDSNDFVVADGGIIDNIPLGRALDAISRTPASCPTRRVLVYLHPSGPAIAASGAAEDLAPGADGADRRGPAALARGLVASKLQGQSIDDDLEIMEAGNRNLRLRRQMRRATAAQVRPDDDFIALALSRRNAYLEQRAAVDAESVRRLLQDPLVVLGEDPFPLAPQPGGDDRWRAPTALWTAEQRLELVTVLRERFLGRLEDRFEGPEDELVSLRGLLTGGLGPLTRTGELLMELALAVEARHGVDHDLIGSLKADLYRLNSLVRELDRIRQVGWVAAAGRLGSSSVDSWVAATLTDLNRLLRCRREVALALCNGIEASSGSDTLDQARRHFTETCDSGLQRMAVGGSPESVEDLVDIREVIILAMGFIADGLVAQWDGSTSGADDNGASYIRDVLAQQTAATYEYGSRFAALEVLLLREQLLGASAGVEVSFTRLSAAAPTVDAERYRCLYEASARLNPTYTGPDQLLPDVKLAGNEMHNFGSFVDERWRSNDWLWGRMDAVPTLVDLLLGLDRAEAERPDPMAFAEYLDFDSGTPDLAEVRRQLIRRRQDEIFEEMAAQMRAEGVAGCDRDHWDIGLETLTVPGTPARARAVGDMANVGALVVGAVLPASVPRVTGPLQGVAAAVARRFATPKGWGPDAGPAPRVGEAPRDRRKAATPTWAYGVAPVVGILVAAAVWGLAGSGPSLLIGFVAGIVVALVPGLFTLWLGAFRRPVPSRRTRLLLPVLPYITVGLLSAAVAVVVTG